MVTKIKLNKRKLILKNKFFIILSFFSFCFNLMANETTASSDKKNENIKPCEVTKEFITIFEFLKSKIELVGTEKSAALIAKKAASSCQGAAARFIRTVSVFNDIEIDNRSLIDIALEVSAFNDIQATSFQQIFQKNFVSNGLDQELYSSIRIAKKLALLNDSDSLQVTEKMGEDYLEFVEFCLSDNGLQLAKPICAELSAKFIGFRSSNKKSISVQIKNLHHFLMSDMEAAKRPIPDKNSFLKIAEKILSKNEFAVENFKEAFKYASSESGLKLTTKESIKFSLDLVTSTK